MGSPKNLREFHGHQERLRFELNNATAVAIMPSTLHKTKKQISKKRNGTVNALHDKSRDSLRLHRAVRRDQRLEKLAAARSKKEQPILERAFYFQEQVQDTNGEPLTLEVVQACIDEWIHQYDEEYNEIKSTRRKGQPAKPREDLLKLKASNLAAEYETGFCELFAFARHEDMLTSAAIPDVLSEENAKKLNEWDGNWGYLTTIPWIKVQKTGRSRSADFPSKGLN